MPAKRASSSAAVSASSSASTTAEAAGAPFAWDDLGRYKASGRFLDGYPDGVRTFYSPVDDVHGVLVALLRSTQKSIVLNMYGYDDDELDEIIVSKLTNERVYVQMSLDKSQAGGVHERELLKRWQNDAAGNSIATWGTPRPGRSRT